MNWKWLSQADDYAVHEKKRTYGCSGYTRYTSSELAKTDRMTIYSFSEK